MKKCISTRLQKVNATKMLHTDYIYHILYKDIMLKWLNKKIKQKIRRLFLYAFSESEEISTVRLRNIIASNVLDSDDYKKRLRTDIASLFPKIQNIVDDRELHETLLRVCPELKICYNDNLFLERMIKNFPELNDLKSCGRHIMCDVHVNLKTGDNVKIYTPSHVSDTSIGDYTYIAQNCYISMATIGKFCSIGPNLLCGWGIHPTNGISTHPMFYSTGKQNGMTLSKEDKVIERKQITIGNDVFIGANVTILDGVTIGNGAVIGAGAVVTKDIPPYAIAVGCPIKIIRYRFDEETCNELNLSEWWNNKEKLQEVEKNIFNVEQFTKDGIH